MNQRFDPTENRNIDPAAWPAEQASQRTDATTDPLTNQRRLEEIEPRATRSSWPILLILLAGLVLALLVWLPSEMSSDQSTTPATTEQTPTPADNATPPADTSMTPGTVTPNATPDTSATPNATPATPDTQTPATGTDTQTPATGTAPQN